jgi:RNA polymerase sigma-70 factor, ECF subfamily
MEIHPEVWQQHQRYLIGVAYRLLGSVAEAEDAVQEAYLRLRRAKEPADGGITDLRSWLTTVVSRICIDQLRSARVRRESYVGTWLPEPLVGPVGVADPADRVTMDESVHMAMLVVLETLTPAERTAFILHDVFGLEFSQVAEAVGRSEVACRQLASRARRRVRGGTARFDVRKEEYARVVTAFLEAARHGNLDDLIELLAADVVMRSDGGGVVPAARWPVHGAERVGKLLLGLTRLYRGARIRMVAVNGLPGFVAERDGAVLSVASITVVDGRITSIDTVNNPEKLRHVRPGQPASDAEWTL